jgi:hypothetical protein
MTIDVVTASSTRPAATRVERYNDRKRTWSGT